MFKNKELNTFDLFILTILVLILCSFITIWYLVICSFLHIDAEQTGWYIVDTVIGVELLGIIYLNTGGK